MARLRALIFAERAILDAASNNVTLVSMLDQINMVKPTAEQLAAKSPKATPAAAFHGVVVSFWERESFETPETKCAVKLSLLGPNGNELLHHTQELDLSEHVRGRLIGHVSDLPIPQSGCYTWQVSVRANERWMKKGVYDYSVRLVEDESALAESEEEAKRAARSHAEALSS